jgi:hypothetical protein
MAEVTSTAFSIADRVQSARSGAPYLLRPNICCGLRIGVACAGRCVPRPGLFSEEDRT